MKVFVALPVYGGYHPHFVFGLLELMAGPRPCPLMVKQLVGDSLVARARNRLAAQFLASDATHLLFLDTDLIFSPDHIERLVGHADAGGHAIVAGLYPKKQKQLAWVCNVEDPEIRDGIDEAADLVPVKYAGTGCLMIAREVFERMIDRWGDEIAYQPDDGETGLETLWDFFSVGVWECPRSGRRRYLSEDWYFCQRARDLGYQIMMDTRVVLKHCGEAVYPLEDIESDATGAA